MKMNPLRWTLAAMAAFTMTATFVAVRTDLFGQVADTISDVTHRSGENRSEAVAASLRSAQAADFRWTGRLEPGSSLEVKNLNGNVTARPTSGREAVVVAEVSGRGGDASEIHIEVLEHDGGITLCAVYPTPRGRKENTCAPGRGGRMSQEGNHAEVDFIVEVPDGVDFAGRTVNGDVEALDLAADVVAVTVNGDVDVATAGFARAETVNGSIDAILGGTVFEGARFSTVNGSIRLDLADDLDADIDARWLNGGFDSELPFALQGRLTRQSARGTLGAGGPVIELETVNGSIRIR